VSRYQKGKTSFDFTEARDSEWQWHQLGRMQVCTSLQTDNHASTPPLNFLHARCPSCRRTNNIKALKAKGILKQPMGITGSHFTSSKQECQSTERNSEVMAPNKELAQITHWPHSFFMQYRTTNGRGIASYMPLSNSNILPLHLFNGLFSRKTWVRQ